MSKELAPQRVTLSFPTLITDCIGGHVSKVFEKSVEELTGNINEAIEKGVATDSTAASAESVAKQGLQVLKAAHNIRMEFTRPLDTAKTKCITQEREYLSQLQEATDKLNGMVIEEAARKEREKQRLLDEAEAENRRREEAARKEEERRIAISQAKGGTGENVKPVVVETVVAPVAHITMRNTTRLKSRVDDDKIRAAIDRGVRDIPGVRIYPVWNFVVEVAKEVPKEYRKFTR